MGAAILGNSNGLPINMKSNGSTLWLVAEDSDDDFFLFERACSRMTPSPKLQRASNGVEAQDYLAGNAPFNDRDAYPLPAVVLSDLKMPLLNGLDLLAWFKHQPGDGTIPFVLMTNSDAQSDRDRAYENGADEYLLKPSRFDDLVKAVANVWERY